MKAMVLTGIGKPLELQQRPDPEPGPGEIRVRVEACAVCRTDLHVVDGELPNPKVPIVPGHEIVGIVESVGEGATALRLGDRVGIPWL
jgi:propanol-preferring alcohol dehydrogenase